MMITLFADASWCPNTRAAGWGSWVNEQCDRQARKHMQQRRIELQAAV